MTRDDAAPSAIARVRARKTDGREFLDSVVVEEPLQIRLRRGSGDDEALAVTMRTPGADLELAAGFLFSEGVVTQPSQLLEVIVCGDRTLTPRQRANTVVATVSADTQTPQRMLDRNFTMSSACGVCGSTQLDDLHKRGIRKVTPSAHAAEVLAALTEDLPARQKVFAKTGGLHAAALLAPDLAVRWVREDVGRHNAVDKVIGAALMAGELPLSGWTLVCSGRIGYEIVQKAIVAGVSALVAVSAPTSLALDTAREFGLTVVGFARNGAGTQY
jgi:FdhD protein